MLGKKQIYLILTALCFLVYANSLNNAFVSDDMPAIVNNPMISGPLHWLHPVMLLNSLNYLTGGQNPFAYHLTNIILHCIAAILVFKFLNLFFGPMPGLLGAGLFAAHPVNAEAVGWISGRPYILLAIFILSAYFLYNSATGFTGKKNRFNPAHYLLSLLLFAYYLIENLYFYVLFPFFLVLSDFTFGRWRKNWRYWAPFLAILALRLILAKGIISWRISYVAKEAGAAGAAWSNPIYNMAYSLYSHAALLLWPAKLTLYHEPAVISRLTLKCTLVALSGLLILLPFIFKKAKEIFFALGIFILFLSPTYSPVMVAWLAAERYLYFPSIALCMVFAFLYERYSIRAEKLKTKSVAVLFLFIFIISAFAARAVARNEDWKTPERLWRQTVLASPESPRAHNNMGDAFAQEGNLDAAIGEFKKAIELRPDYADAYHNLANIYQKQGSLEDAARFYKEAIRFNPELFESHFDLGLIYLNSGEIDAAVEHFKKAQELRPEDTDALAALNFAVNKKALR